MHTFFITPGEFHGVGLEISLKALKKINTSTERFIVWTEKKYFLKNFPELKSTNFYQNTLEVPKEPGVFFMHSTLSPAEWFKESVKVCKKHPNEFGIVTGPLEKKSFNDINALGHTEYLRQVFPDLSIYMTFFGDVYNCLLLTDHCPLKDVSKLLSKQIIEKGLYEAQSTSKKLKYLKPILLLGLNPHAGEGGLLGDEERELHLQVKKDNTILGPISPDGLFGLAAYKNYSFIVANYHDQGLIPFKAINGFSAAQASLGIPFIRTSVDHGTASDIFGMDKANPDSMIRAIKLAQGLKL